MKNTTIKNLLDGTECVFKLIKNYIDQDQEFELHLNLHNAAFKLKSEVELISCSSTKTEYFKSLERTGKCIRKLYGWLYTFQLTIENYDTDLLTKIKTHIDGPYIQLMNELKLTELDAFYSFEPNDSRAIIQDFLYEKD